MPRTASKLHATWAAFQSPARKRCKTVRFHRVSSRCMSVSVATSPSCVVGALFFCSCCHPMSALHSCPLLSLEPRAVEGTARRDFRSTSPALVFTDGTRRVLEQSFSSSPTSLEKSGSKAERAHVPFALFHRSNLSAPTSRRPPHSPRPSPRLALQRIDEQCLSI